jgi:hypothetical protein
VKTFLIREAGTGELKAVVDLTETLGDFCRSTNYESDECRTVLDLDEDGIPGMDDNCPAVPNEGQEDLDEDGVGDACDNCREVENWDQKDTNYLDDDNPNSDGYQHYGNACDADYDNNGFVGLPDFNKLRSCFGKSTADFSECEDVDCDNDGFIGLSDFNCLRTFFGKEPGPGIGD